MKRYLIERDIPNVGRLDPAQLKELAVISNGAIAKLCGRVQRVQSFVAIDRTFCVYLSESESEECEHSRLAIFPTTINEIAPVIDPMTAMQLKRFRGASQRLMPTTLSPGSEAADDLD